MNESIWSLIVVALVVIVPLWRICGRTGFSPALSLLAVIPLLGIIIVAAVLGFAEWPSLRNRQSN